MIMLRFQQNKGKLEPIVLNSFNDSLDKISAYYMILNTKKIITTDIVINKITYTIISSGNTTDEQHITLTIDYKPIIFGDFLITKYNEQKTNIGIRNKDTQNIFENSTTLVRKGIEKEYLLNIKQPEKENE